MQCMSGAKMQQQAANARVAPVKAHVVVARAPSAAPQNLRRHTVQCHAMDPATFTTSVYAGLGLAGLSFVGTFFVAPQFKDSFKEDKDWRDIYQALQATGGVTPVNPSDAHAASRSGKAILLDVRLASKYEGGHAEGSLSAPLYLPIQKWDAASIIRRAGFAFFGIYGTELNTQFASEVQQRVPQGKQVIVLCETGGSLQNKSGTKFGFQSRSLKAVYYLQQAGFNQVTYVQGGLPAWVRQGYPTADGPEDLSAVPALQPDVAEDDEDSSSSIGGFKLPNFNLKLPQLSFLPSRR